MAKKANETLPGEILVGILKMRDMQNSNKDDGSYPCRDVFGCNLGSVSSSKAGKVAHKDVHLYSKEELERRCRILIGLYSKETGFGTSSRINLCGGPQSLALDVHDYATIKRI